jgi:beta-N-acetylhexosaminidase
MPSKTSLELRQQVGQLLIMGFDGAELSARLRSMLGTFQPGGIILFKRNIEDAAQVHELLRGAQRAVSTPMFLCADMEGGTVDRLRDVIAPVPSVAEVVETGSARLFRKHGELIGAAMRALRFNTDFAPCLDLRFEASRNVLGSRTASENPKTTVRFAREFLRGLRNKNVLGCGKHFPGLGEANLDSHYDLPSVAKPWKRLWSEDLQPYRELRRDLPFVMVAHAAYADVTHDSVPASLSKKWISDILKKKIGYKGLVVSDDLDMGGVLAVASIEDAAFQALAAGNDLMLICQKEESVWRAFDALYRQAESDRRFAKLVAERSKRVLDFKRKSRALRASPAPRPSQKAVNKLRRDVWEFSEAVRLSTAAVVEARR